MDALGCSEAGHDIWLKRDDLIHPELSGNKLRKLQGWLEQALKAGAHGLATCGGPHSQHLLALAFAGQALGLATRGFVRGHHRQESPLLARCRALGMELVFVDQAGFRVAFQTPGFQPELPPGWFFVPMGAAGPEALPGIAELWQEVNIQLTQMSLPLLDAVAVSAGTGTFAAGLLRATQDSSIEIWAFPAFRADARLREDILSLAGVSLQEAGRLSLHYRPEHGRFGQVPTVIEAFAKDFHHRTGISLEQVYEAKMLYGLTHLLKETQPRKRVLAVLAGAPFGN